MRTEDFSQEIVRSSGALYLLTFLPLITDAVLARSRALHQPGSHRFGGIFTGVSDGIVI